MSTTPPEQRFSPSVTSLKSEGAYAVMAAAAAVQATTSTRVIHLEIGQPGFPTPSPIAAAGIAAIEAGNTKYVSPGGTQALREAIAVWTGRTRGVRVGVENVCVGPGAKPGLFFVALALVRAGDEVVIPDPGFPTYRAMVEVAGGSVVPVRLGEGGKGYDLVELEKRVSGKTRVVVVNSPGNPTGGVCIYYEVLCLCDDAMGMTNAVFEFFVMRFCLVAGDAIGGLEEDSGASGAA